MVVHRQAGSNSQRANKMHAMHDQRFGGPLMPLYKWRLAIGARNTILHRRRFRQYFAQSDSQYTSYSFVRFSFAMFFLFFLLSHVLKTAVSVTLLSVLTLFFGVFSANKEVLYCSNFM